MLEPPFLSLRVRPLAIPELLVLRLLSRLQADAGAMLRAVLRVRFLRASIGMGFGWRAERGMAVAEDGLMLILMSRPSITEDEVRRKGEIVRAYLGEAPRGNTDVMMAAAIEADLVRLGLLNAHDGDREVETSLH